MIHCILEGIALGVVGDDIMVMFIAVGAHKVFAAFALGGAIFRAFDNCKATTPLTATVAAAVAVRAAEHGTGPRELPTCKITKSANTLSRFQGGWCRNTGNRQM